MHLRPIDTIYNGYKFRSRLEARWAVFFDTLGVPYEYEKEGFNLDNVWYLPDFWLPEQQCWIEIKAGEPTPEELEKAKRLALHSKQDVHLLHGEIKIPQAGDGMTWVWARSFFGSRAPTDEQFHSSSEWCECPICRKVGLARLGDATELPCGCLRKTLPLEFDQLLPYGRLQNASEEEERAFFSWWMNGCLKLFHTIDSPRLVTAYTAARQARFEHGEHGR